MADVFWGNVWDWDFDLEKGGKSNPKLIPMKKTIYKDGKPYQQTFWVLPDEIQGNDKQVHSDLKEHLRHVRKTLGADKYKNMLSDNGVKWNSHASDKIDTMNATSAAIEHLKNGGTLTHKGENDEEHVVTGKHQSEHADEQHAEDNKSKPFHVYNQKTKQFEPVNGVPVSVGDDFDAFMYQLKDGKYVVSEANSGFAFASNSGNGYDTKEEALGAAKKTISNLGADKLKQSIKTSVKMNGISPSQSHNYKDIMGGDKKDEPKKDNTMDTITAASNKVNQKAKEDYEKKQKEKTKPTVSAKKPAPKHVTHDDGYNHHGLDNHEDVKAALEAAGIDPEEEVSSIKDMNGENVKVGDTVKDTNGKNFIVTKIEANGTVWGKRIGKGKENAKPKIIKNGFKKFSPKGGTPVVPAKKKEEPEKYKSINDAMVDLENKAGMDEDTVDKIQFLLNTGFLDKAKKMVTDTPLSDFKVKDGEQLNAKKEALKILENTKHLLGDKKTEPKKPEAKPTVPAGKKGDIESMQIKSDVNKDELKSLKSELKKIDGLPDGLINDLLQAVADKGFGMHTKNISQKLKDDGKITQGQLYNIGDAFVSAIKEHSKILEQKQQEAIYKLEKEKFGDNVITPSEKTQLKTYFSEWYGSSTNSHATAMRSMLERLGMVAKGCFLSTLAYMGGHNNYDSIQKKAALHSNATMMSALKKLQKYTHEELKSKGGSGTVVLYRRISDYQMKEMLKSKGKAVYKHNPIDSWSTRDDLTGFGSVVMKYEVPIEHVLSNHQNMLTKAGWSNGEQEWFPLPQSTDLNLELGKNCWIGDVPHSEIKKNVYNNLPYLSKSSSSYYSKYLDGSWDSELKKVKDQNASAKPSKPTAWKPPSSSNKAVTKAQQHAKKLIKEVMKKHGEYNFDAHAAENLDGIGEEKYHEAIDDIKKNPDFLKYLKKKGAVASNWEPDEDDEYDNHKLEEHADDLLHQEIDNWQGNEHTLKKSEILIIVPLDKRD